MGKKVPLTLESAQEGYRKFLKINKLKESETPADAELAAKKAGWEKRIAELKASQNGAAKKAKGGKEKKAAKTTRESQKYDYPKGMDDPKERKKYRAKMRAEAAGGGKKKAKKDEKAGKVKGKAKKAKAVEADEDED